MEQTPTIIHRADIGRYEWNLGDAVAYIEYHTEVNTLTILRTFVPESHAGQGIAGRLTEAVLREITAHGHHIDPQCSFTARWVERHPEWQKWVASSDKE